MVFPDGSARCQTDCPRTTQACDPNSIYTNCAAATDANGLAIFACETQTMTCGPDVCGGCIQDSDCHAGEVCIQANAPNGNLGFCGATCADGGSCAAGEACQALTDANATTSIQACYPGDGGSCLGYLPDGGCGGVQYQSCATNADCGCGLLCNADPAFTSTGAGVCEYPCTTSTDCPDLFTTCQSGVCASNQSCANRAVGDLCNAAGTNDGTCLSSGLCLQGGSAAPGAACSTVRGTANCQTGSACLTGPAGDGFCPPPGPCPAPAGGEIGLCRPLCDPTLGDGGAFSPDAGACTAGTICEGVNLAEDNASVATNHTTLVGYCFPADGGCAVGPSNALAACGPGSGCSCGLACVPDPQLADGGAASLYDALGNGTFCELPCTATANCPDPTTACLNAGHCTENFCTPATPTSFGTPCAAASSGSGICLQNGDNNLGICVETGTATTRCDPFASRQQGSLLCPQGSYCFTDVASAGGCLTACDPGASANTCPATQACNSAAFTPVFSGPDDGYCQ